MLSGARRRWRRTAAPRMRTSLARPAPGADARAAPDLAHRDARSSRRLGAGQDDGAGDELSRSPACSFSTAASIMALAALGGEKPLVRRGGATRTSQGGSGRTRMTSPECPPVYTIGHSTREHRQFVELLQQGRGRTGCRYPQHSPVTDQSPVQPRRAARNAVIMAGWPQADRVRRSTESKIVPRNRLLDQSELPQLCKFAHCPTSYASAS